MSNNNPNTTTKNATDNSTNNKMNMPNSNGHIPIANSNQANQNNMNNNNNNMNNNQMHSNSSHNNMNNMNNSMLAKPSTTITRPPRNNNMNNNASDNSNNNNNNNKEMNNHLSTVQQQDHYVYQMSMARNINMNNISQMNAAQTHNHNMHQHQMNMNNGGMSPGNNIGGNNNGKPDDYDPDSNVYVANLPSDYGKDRLYKLFATYGQIVRYKFVTPDEPTQPGYGFVQFANRKDAHRAIKNLEGHVFSTGETIYLSIALRRRSSLSDEPTNLYVKNLPSSWTNEKLRKVFGAYGQIRQSKVVGDGIAFVRFEDHDQALNAIGRLDKQMVEQGCKLEVRFATRKTAANAYRLQQIPQSKTNENNLYIRNLPKYYNQSSLETLFANYGKISSAKINDNGIAFVRFAHAEDAKRAIQELNGKKPPQFEEEIVVKLAHFDIGDSRNRWANKFGSGSSNMNNMSGNNGGGGHFNNNMYQNHFNAPIGSMNQQYGHAQNVNPYANGSFHSPNVAQSMQSNGTPLPSVPSSNVSDHQSNNAHAHSQAMQPNMNNMPSDVNVSVNMNNPLNASITNANMQAAQQPNMMQFGLNSQMQAIQQQMQQFNIANTNQVQSTQGGNGATTNVQLNQFAFPAATPVMMPAPTLFTANPMANPAQNTNTQLPNTSLPRQISNDSHNSVGSGAASPQSNHSNGSNDANKSKTWSKKQQELGDKLYQKVHPKCGRGYAPKITGMLIKMGDKKAQQCIDDPAFLDQQIEIAKKLLENTEGIPTPNGQSALNNNTPTAANTLSPTSLLQQHSQSPTAANGIHHTPLMNRLNGLNNHQFTSVNSPNIGLTTPNRFQALNTKPVTPNANISNINSPNNATTPNQAIHTQQINQQTLLNPVLTSSIPNLLTSSIPNSLYGALPILSTPQLIAMSPAPATAHTPNGHSSGGTTPNQQLHNKQTVNTMQHMQHMQQLNVTNPSQAPQYLFMPNFTNGVVTSPAHQHHIYNMNGVNVVTTPNSLEQQQMQHAQQQTMQSIQQGGWGLAVNPQINVIQTQPATQFMQPALYPKTQ